jgi:hypothetical protein
MLRPIVAAALALALPASAGAAGVLNTPPGYAGTGANVQCLLQNLDGRAQDAAVSLVGADGVVLEGPQTVSVAAGGVASSVNTGGPSEGYVYCRFEGLSKKVRGWLTVIDSAGTRTMVPAAK